MFTDGRLTWSIKTHFYVEISSCYTKQRSVKHISLFRNITKIDKQVLFKRIWVLKDSNKVFSIAWEIISNTKLYRIGNNRRGLCGGNVPTFHI